MGLDDVPAKHLTGPDAAVVRTLRSGEAVARPAVGPARAVEQGVLLLEPEPVLVVAVLVEQLRGVGPEVVLVRGAVRHPGLAHDEDVVAEAERVREQGRRSEVDVRVVAGSLAGGGAVEIPFRQVFDGFGRFAQGLSGTNSETNKGKRISLAIPILFLETKKAYPGVQPRFRVQGGNGRKKGWGGMGEAFFSAAVVLSREFFCRPMRVRDKRRKEKEKRETKKRKRERCNCPRPKHREKGIRRSKERQ